MKVTIDQDRCIGSGQCVLVLPDVFDQRDEDGIVVLLDSQPPAEHGDKVQEAVLMCPALAITIDE